MAESTSPHGFTAIAGRSNKIIGNSFYSGSYGGLIPSASMTLYQGHFYPIGTSGSMGFISSSIIAGTVGLPCGLYDGVGQVPPQSTLVGDGTKGVSLSQPVGWIANDATYPTNDSNDGKTVWFTDGDHVGIGSAITGSLPKAGSQEGYDPALNMVLVDFQKNGL